ncbi:melatonin receptor type 1B-A-like [Mytilus californianus]|uniref:melatonin receptor type 1B-A-like n=1 Tax=Mytilus californianus TaxID=6549 RepID=UPI00224653C8|nr:melatonin receptor type 1B-A-like [Mytilus californianus]
MNDSFCTKNATSKDCLYFRRFEFIQESPGFAILSILLLVIASLVGTFGNFLILIVVSKAKELRQVQSVFMVNLAISDLYVTMIADPMSIVGKVEGRQFFMQYPVMCEIIGKVCTVSCIASLGSITLLSFNRYILICHNSHYERIFTRRSCIIMCISLYIVGMIMVLLNSAGIGGHGFDDKSLECIWDRMATYSYTVVFSVCLVWIPLIVVGISYLKLFLYVRHKRKQVTSRENAPIIDNKSLRLAKTIFIVYAVFSICWIPFAMLLVADVKDTFSHEVHLSITVFAHLHPSINWLIYFYTNRNFKTGCHKIFKIGGQEFSSQPIGPLPKSAPVMSIHMKSVSSEDGI